LLSGTHRRIRGIGPLGNTGTGYHLAGGAHKFGVGVLGEPLEIVVDYLVAVLVCSLGDVDERLKGLDLAEEKAAVSIRVPPMFEQPPSNVGDGRVMPFAPDLHTLPDEVDRLVFFNAVRRPVLEGELLVLRLLLGLGDGDELVVPLW
jgi:hypothetical protein